MESIIHDVLFLFLGIVGGIFMYSTYVQSKEIRRKERLYNTIFNCYLDQRSEIIDGYENKHDINLINFFNNDLEVFENILKNELGIVLVEKALTCKFESVDKNNNKIIKS